MLWATCVCTVATPAAVKLYATTFILLVPPTKFNWAFAAEFPTKTICGDKEELVIVLLTEMKTVFTTELTVELPENNAVEFIEEFTVLLPILIPFVIVTFEDTIEDALTELVVTELAVTLDAFKLLWEEPMVISEVPFEE